ncbi:MAG: sigma-70 family RNA polymerase sigma factor [Planctomycetota bacterium]
MSATRSSSDSHLTELAAHDQFVRTLARRLISDAHLAEDLAQEAWVAVLRQSPATLHALRAWLGTVTRNFARQALRGRARREARERVAARAVMWEPADAPLEEAMRARLLAAVDGLDESYRTVIRLRFFDDLPPTLIAERLALPIETVRTRLKRGLTRLRASYLR